MTIVVAGSSGNTGAAVAESLLSQGRPVRAITRDPRRPEAVRARGAEVVEASLSDASSLVAAFANAESAYLLLPPIASSERTLAEQAEMTDAIAIAIERSELKHVVFLSSIGAHLAGGTGPIRGLAYAEQRLRRVPKTRFTFLRPGYFMENYASSLEGLSRGVFQTYLHPERMFPQVATADIGQVAARELVEGARHTEVLELAGPTDLTITDVARTFAELLNKPLELEVAPVEVMVELLTSRGLSRDFAQLYAEMVRRLNKGGLGYEGGHRFERGTTPMSAVARKLLDAAQKRDDRTGGMG